MKGWLHLDLVRLLLLAVPVTAAYAAVMTWVPAVARPAWMVGSTAVLALTCLLLLGSALRDTPRRLGAGYAAFFLVYVALVALAADMDLLAGPRTPLAGFAEERPSNLLGLGWLEDWHYRVAPPAPEAGELIVVTFPSFAGARREEVRRQLAFLVRQARENQARGVAFDIFLERPSAYDPRLRREVEAARAAGMPVVFGERQVETPDGLLVRQRLAPALEEVVPEAHRGHLQGYREADGEVRLIPAVLPGVGERPALSAVVASLLTGAELELPSRRLLRFVPPRGGLVVEPFDPSLDWSLLRDRFVIAGSASPSDRVETPFGEAQGVEVHAWAAHALATGAALVDVDPRLTWPLVFVLCYALTALYARGLGRRRLFLAAGVLSLVVVAVAAVAARAGRLWLEVGYPLIALWLLSGLLVVLRLLRRRLAGVSLHSRAADSEPGEAPRETVADVFLAHNSRDKEAVRELAAALRQRGLRPWVDEEQLVPGQRWQEGLEEALRACSACAVLIGESGIGRWERMEGLVAVSQHVERGMPVIPVLLPGAPEPGAALPLMLQQFEVIDLRGGLRAGALARLEWGITGRKPAVSA